MGLDSVLVITDKLDENLFLASRNLPNVLVVEPRYADPVSLVFYKKVLITKAALAKIEEMLRMSAAIANISEERLMKVLLAPVISEKATLVAEKNEQVVFKVLPDATKPEIKAAVELMFKVEVESVQVANREGQGQALRPFHRPPQPHQAGLSCA